MDAVQTFPHPALQNYIAQYLFLSLANPAEFGDLKQTFFPLALPALAFFTKKLHLNSKHDVNYHACTVYTELINGPVSLTFTESEPVQAFIVVFKPCVFSDLFKMNTADATDYFPDFVSIKGKEARILYEQLMDAESFAEKIKI